MTIFVCTGSIGIKGLTIDIFLFVWFYSDENDKGFVRVYPGKLQLQIEDAFVNVPVDNDTTVSDLVRDALNRFGLQDNKIEDYRFVSFHTPLFS